MMDEQPQSRSLAAQIGAFLVSQGMGYVAFFINVPFALSLLVMAMMILIIMDRTYHIPVFAFVASFAPNGKVSVHWDGAQFMAMYAKASFVLFVCWAIVRALFRLKHATLKRHLLTVIGLATAGYIFIALHMAAMTAPQNLMKMYGVLFVFYIFGVGAFTVGALIMRACDLLIDHVVAR